MDNVLHSAALAFLIYNFFSAKIFMGDTGSLLLGLINSILVIKFINIAGSPVSNFPIQSSPDIGFAILMIPLFDTLRVFTIPILNRRSPFSLLIRLSHFFFIALQPFKNCFYERRVKYNTIRSINFNAKSH